MFGYPNLLTFDDFITILCTLFLRTLSIKHDSIDNNMGFIRIS